MDSTSTNNHPANDREARHEPESVVTRIDAAALSVRSPQVQEIIGRPPHWLVRWGITAFLGVLLLVLASAWVIRSPEGIPAPFTLVAIQGPVTLEARTGGKLVRLLAGSDSRVGQGQVLAWLESRADHRVVLELSEQVDSMMVWAATGQLQRIQNMDVTGFGRLGELQPAFHTVQQALRELIEHLPGGFYERQREMLGRELAFNRQLHDHLAGEQEIRRGDYELALQEFDIQQRLAEQEFIAPIELARAERELASRRLPLQQSASALIGNRQSQITIERQLMELDRMRSEQGAGLLQALGVLRNGIDEWTMLHIVTAPFTGKLIHAGILQENMTLQSGQLLFYLQPDTHDYFGEVRLGQASIGKIHPGQAVLVRLSGYPDAEFGTVRGRLDYISEIPVQDSVFVGKVVFPDGLSTNYGHELTPRSGLTGQAEIYTEERSLLERIYENIAGELR